MIRSLLAMTLPGLLGILVLLLLRPLGAVPARNAAMRLICATALPLAGIRLQIEGDTALLQQRPAVFIINHQSAVDPLLVAALLRRDVQGVAKQELRRHPLMGPLLRLAGTVFVHRDRQRGSEQLFPALVGLARGQAVALAPEGTRSFDEKLNQFRPGALWLAREANVPLIPIIIHDSYRILERGHWRIRPGTVRIAVHAPVHAASTDLNALESLYRAQLAQTLL